MHSSAQFLSRSLKSADTIGSYISGVKQLHLLVGADYPHTGAFALKLTLRGLRNVLQHLPHRAAAITPEMLSQFYHFLDLSKPVNATVWCIFLFAFFLMARSSNLVPKSVHSFDPKKQLLRGDIFTSHDFLLVALRWSKTNQSGGRVVQVPLLPVAGHPLCPVSAFHSMCRLSPASDRDPAFGVHKGKKFFPLTYSQFQSYLGIVVNAVKLNASGFSTHSFRRGGATWAFKAQVPSDLIQIHGDWASDAYKVYLECDLEQRAKVAEMMGNNIQSFVQV